MQLPFDRRTCLKHVFATPIGFFQLPNTRELASKIADIILAREKTDPGLDISNFGGWHSDNTLMDWPELGFADLADTFRSAVSHMISATSGIEKFNTQLNLSAWANVNRAGAANNSHIHPENHWSGVLYIQTPDLSADTRAKAGHIEFQDPRGPVSMLKTPGQQSVMSVSPQEGMIVVFPSWLYHWVNAFSVDAVRISIAFNACINKFEVLEG